MLRAGGAVVLVEWREAALAYVEAMGSDDGAAGARHRVALEPDVAALGAERGAASAQFDAAGGLAGTGIAWGWLCPAFQTAVYMWWLRIHCGNLFSLMTQVERTCMRGGDRRHPDARRAPAMTNAATCSQGGGVETCCGAKHKEECAYPCNTR